MFMFKELKMLLDEFYELEGTIKDDQKIIDKLESEIKILEKRLNTLYDDYKLYVENNNDMVERKRELEIIINNKIKEINK